MESKDRPNILFLLADDLGWGDVGFHDSEIDTPNLDRLAATGVELERHYVCPVCTPTRTSLLTGRHPGRFGPHATRPSNSPVLPDGYETLAGMLRENGYATGLFGKWHLGSTPEVGPNHFGFDYAYGSLAGGVDPYNHRYKQGEFSVTWHRNGEFVEEPGHVTDLIVDEAVDWIERTDGPWFCYVPFTAVHIPVKAPQEFLDGYADRQYSDDPVLDLAQKRYYAYASQMDAGIGRLVEVLERMCIRDRTIVIFSSDNGAMPNKSPQSVFLYPGYQQADPIPGSNLPWRGHKATLYEGGIRTPTLIHWQGTLEPGRMSIPVHIADWMPTFSKLLGCPASGDPQWDGVDIWPLIADGGAEAAVAPVDYQARAIFWNLKENEFAVQQGGWKLITRLDEGSENAELYNLEEDPREMRNVAPQHPKVVRELLDRIEDERRLDGVSRRPEVTSANVNDEDSEP